MTAELLFLISLHTFKSSQHNLRPNGFLGIFLGHAHSAANGLSSPSVIGILTMAYFSKFLLVELDKSLEVIISHLIENTIFFFLRYSLMSFDHLIHLHTITHKGTQHFNHNRKHY